MNLENNSVLILIFIRKSKYKYSKPSVFIMI